MAKSYGELDALNDEQLREVASSAMTNDESRSIAMIATRRLANPDYRKPAAKLKAKQEATP